MYVIIPGVRHESHKWRPRTWHAHASTEVSDAVALRKRIAEKFELAALPGTTEEERKAALHFVVVGGGPTGVEFAGTLSDFVREDLKKKYPSLMKYVRVTLLNVSLPLVVCGALSWQRPHAALELAWLQIPPCLSSLATCACLH